MRLWSREFLIYISERDGAKILDFKKVDVYRKFSYLFLSLKYVIKKNLPIQYFILRVFFFF
jgi:hypothetical protein